MNKQCGKNLWRQDMQTQPLFSCNPNSTAATATAATTATTTATIAVPVCWFVVLINDNHNTWREYCTMATSPWWFNPYPSRPKKRARGERYGVSDKQRRCRSNDWRRSWCQVSFFVRLSTPKFLILPSWMVYKYCSYSTVSPSTWLFRYDVSSIFSTRGATPDEHVDSLRPHGTFSCNVVIHNNNVLLGVGYTAVVVIPISDFGNRVLRVTSTWIYSLGRLRALWLFGEWQLDHKKPLLCLVHTVQLQTSRNNGTYIRLQYRNNPFE